MTFFCFIFFLSERDLLLLFSLLFRDVLRLNGISTYAHEVLCDLIVSKSHRDGPFLDRIDDI